MLNCVEICAGGGGQAVGLEKAGFEPLALVEIDEKACETLRNNRPEWNVLNGDLKGFSGFPYHGADLLAGGVPCPPFSLAGKQLGKDDERDLFPEALRLGREIRPKAIMLENVRGFLGSNFDTYRSELEKELLELGYKTDIRLLHSSDYGVPQLRPRAVLIAIQEPIFQYFSWPETSFYEPARTVGETLIGLMKQNGWLGADAWKMKANRIAPTIVGGSKKHGGPDLGPTRAKRAWLELGVDGMGIANEAPEQDFEGNPRLTVEMVALLQGFDASWRFAGRKTPAYRQVGNAFPPPVAEAVATSIKRAIEAFRNSSAKAA